MHSQNLNCIVKLVISEARLNSVISIFWRNYLSMLGFRFTRSAPLQNLSRIVVSDLVSAAHERGC